MICKPWISCPATAGGLSKDIFLCDLDVSIFGFNVFSDFPPLPISSILDSSRVDIILNVMYQ